MNSAMLSVLTTIVAQLVVTSAVIDDAAPDTACGPRVAQCVMEWYGRPVPNLSQAIRAIQGAELDQGASFLQLQAFFRNNGLYAVGVHSAIGDVPCWDGPIVLLLKSHAATSRRPQQYHLVLLTDTNVSAATYTLWEPLSGQRVLKQDAFARLWTGDALVVSDAPIDTRWIFGQYWLRFVELSLSALLLAEIAIVIVLVVIKMMRNSHLWCRPNIS